MKRENKMTIESDLEKILHNQERIFGLIEHLLDYICDGNNTIWCSCDPYYTCPICKLLKDITYE